MPDSLNTERLPNPPEPVALAEIRQSLGHTCPRGGVAVLFRSHDVSNIRPDSPVYFPVCLASSAFETQLVEQRYFLFPTVAPDKIATGRAKKVFERIDGTTALSRLLTFGRVPVALFEEGPIWCSFFDVSPDGQAQHFPPFIVGLFAPRKGTIDRKTRLILSDRLRKLVKEWEGESPYAEKLRIATSPSQVVQLVVRLAADVDVDPPYAPLLYVKASLPGADQEENAAANPLSWNCLVQLAVPKLKYLLEMVETSVKRLKDNSLGPWVHDLLDPSTLSQDDFRQLEPVAQALIPVVVDVVKPRAVTSNGYLLLPRHNKQRHPANGKLDDTEKQKYESRPSRPPLLSAWNMIKEALCNLTPEPDDVAVFAWIGGISDGTGKAEVFPIGMVIDDNSELSSRKIGEVEFPDSHKISSVPGRPLSVEGICIGGKGSLLEPHAAEAIRVLTDAGCQHIERVSTLDSVYEEYQKKFGGVEGSEIYTGFFREEKHDLFGGRPIPILRGLPIAIGNRKFKQRDDAADIRPAVREALTVLGKHLGWDEPLKNALIDRLMASEALEQQIATAKSANDERLIARLSAERDLALVPLFLCAKAMSDLSTVWLPLLWLSCPAFTMHGMREFRLDEWYRLRADIRLADRRTGGYLMKRFADLRETLRAGGEKVTTEWRWAPPEGPATYLMVFDCDDDHAREVAGSVATMAPPGDRGLRVVLRQLQDAGIWVYPSAMNGQLRLVISLPARFIR